MSKTTRKDLAEHVQTELIAYLKAGRPINQDQIARALDETGLEIQDLDRLLRIRFALSKTVQEYLEDLPERLRRIRTESEVQREEARGGIRGSIDWGQTIRQRYKENPADRSQYITRTPHTEYQLPENILVKTLLAIIADTARTELLDINYQWRRDLWTDGAIRAFLRRFDQNVHLDRINANKDTRITTQAIDQARQSRRPLYYEAYDLYRLYEQLQRREFESKAASELLFDTLVLPKTSTLFELAVIFEILTGFREQLDVSLQSIERGSNAIATMTDNTWEYRVYHDSTGRLRFHEPLPESSIAPYLQRSETALHRHKSVMQRSELRPLYSGRPDIVIEIYQREKSKAAPKHILIGEIKHTSKKSTLSDGIYDIMRYLEFARPDTREPVTWSSPKHLSEQEDVTVRGLVVTDGVEFTPDTDGLPLVHLNFEDIASIDVGSLLKI